MWLFHVVVLHVTFCKQRQRNEQRIITHAYTAIVLVAVAVKVCVNSPFSIYYNSNLAAGGNGTKEITSRSSDE